MNFEHTEDRRMLADSLNRFLAGQYPIETRHAIAYGGQGHSREAYRQLADLGVTGALFPEAAGGLGGQGFDVSVIFECLGRGLSSEPVLGALVVGQALVHSGASIHQPVLEALIEGRAVAALAHDEPGSHYELNRVATTAARAGDGWVLDGAKAVVAFGDSADWLLVSARSEGERYDEHGISLFLVPGDAAGLGKRAYGRIDGGHAAELTFSNVRLPASALLGEAGGGLSLLRRVCGYGVLALCAEALGAMDVVKDHTLEYLRTRQQFGAPIGRFQALQHRMADLLLEVEQARSAVIRAAAAMDDDDAHARERALAGAKYSIGHIGSRVAEESIQLHGGIGMTWELPLAHYAKRLVMIDHQFGDQDHHLTRYMQLGREAAVRQEQPA